jgi:hypothetical protein
MTSEVMPLTVFLNQLSSTSYKSSVACDAHLSITQCFITDRTADSFNTLTVIIFHAILPPGGVITNYILASLQLFSLFLLQASFVFNLLHSPMISLFFIFVFENTVLNGNVIEKVEEC